MAHAIDADADRHGETGIAFAFDQNAGEFRLPEQQVVGPFQLQRRAEPRRAFAERIMQSQCRDERELRRKCPQATGQ